MSKRSTGSKKVIDRDSFDNDEIKIIRKLCKAYKSKAARRSKAYLCMLKKHGRKAIYKKIKSLGLKLPSSPWTTEEDLILLADGRAISRITVRTKLRHRTFESVLLRLKELGAGDGEFCAPQGYISLRSACLKTGLDYPELRRVAKEYKVFIRTYVGRKKTKKQDKHYLEEEQIVDAANKYFAKLNSMTTISEIMKEFDGVGYRMTRDAILKCGIKLPESTIARFTPEEADAIRKCISQKIGNQRGYITIEEAEKKYKMSRDRILIEIDKNKRMVRKRMGVIYIGEIALKKILNNQLVTISKLMKEFNVSGGIVSRAMKQANIHFEGIRGKKLRIDEADAEKVRSILAHRQVMLDSVGGKKVDA